MSIEFEVLVHVDTQANNGPHTHSLRRPQPTNKLLTLDNVVVTSNLSKGRHYSHQVCLGFFVIRS